MNERTFRILFRSVTTSVERMLNEGFVTYIARESGSTELSEWRAAFGRCKRDQNLFSIVTKLLELTYEQDSRGQRISDHKRGARYLNPTIRRDKLDVSD